MVKHSWHQIEIQIRLQKKISRLFFVSAVLPMHINKDMWYKNTCFHFCFYLYAHNLFLSVNESVIKCAEIIEIK